MYSNWKFRKNFFSEQRVKVWFTLFSVISFNQKWRSLWSFRNIFRKIFRCWSTFIFHWNNPSEFLESVDYYWSISIAFENLETIILHVQHIHAPSANNVLYIIFVSTKNLFLGGSAKASFSKFALFFNYMNDFSPRLFFNGNCILPSIIQLR